MSPPCPHPLERAALFGLLAERTRLIPVGTVPSLIDAWSRTPDPDFSGWLESSGRLSSSSRSLIETLCTQLETDCGGTLNALGHFQGDETSWEALSQQETFTQSYSDRTEATIVGSLGVPATRCDGPDPDDGATHAPGLGGATRLPAGLGPVDPHETFVDSTGNGRAEGPDGPSRVRYRAIRFHAKGGLGNVFEAHDEELNRRVALKEIQDAHADRPSSRNRFMIEAEITGRLEHPGIVPIYGLGRYADGRPFYAMRFIQGDSLDEEIRRYHEQRGEQAGELARPFQGLLRRFLDVCNAVEYAHNRGVVHRDLKPQNIMLGKFGETLVVDWGLARVFDKGRDPAVEPDDETITVESLSGSTDTVAGQLIGTLRYMSPEQASGQVDRIGPLSDVYSLGATLYCLLTGEPPLKDVPSEDALPRIRSGQIPSARQLRPDVPRGLDAISRKAMAANPADRYETPLALATDLERWLADEPILAMPDSAASRLARWSRRHRQTTLAAVLTLLTITTFAILSAVWIQSERSRADQESRRSLALEKRAREQAEDNSRVQAELTARAKAESEKAKVESEKVVRALELFVNTFRAADPIGLEGIGVRGTAESTRTMTAQEILERSAAQVESQLNDVPTVRAALEDTMGEVFRSLAQLDKAERLITRAVETRRNDPGATAADLATSLVHLGALRQDQGRFDEARSAFDEALAIRNRLSGPESPEVLTVKFHLGLLLAFTGDLDEAEAMFKNVVDGRIKQLGPGHRDVAMARLGLATVLIDKDQVVQGVLLSQLALSVLAEPRSRLQVMEVIGKFQSSFRAKLFKNYAGAEAQMRAGMEQARVAIGFEHPYIGFFHHELAVLQIKQKKHKEADLSFKTCVDIIRKSVGMRHPKAKIVVQSYGTFLARQGRGKDAQALAEELLRAQKQAHGANHVWYADSLTVASRIESELGNTNRERALLKDAVRIYHLPQKHDPIGFANALFFLSKLVPLDEAEPLLRECLPATIKDFGSRSSDEALTLMRLGMTLVQLNKNDDEAIQVLDRAVDIFRGTNQFDWPTVIYCLGLKAAVLRKRHEADAARSAEAEALDVIRLHEAAIPSDLAEGCEDLCDVLIKIHQREAAIPWLQVALRLRQADRKGTDAERSNTWEQLAFAQLAQGDLAAYRATANAFWQRYQATRDPLVLGRILWVVALDECPIVDPKVLLSLSEAAVSGKHSARHGLANALIRLRAGRPVAALERIQALQKSRTVTNVFDLQLRALAESADGHPTLARATLDQARRIQNPDWNGTTLSELAIFDHQLRRRLLGPPLDLPENVFTPR